jgi:hypothetical protein
MYYDVFQRSNLMLVTPSGSAPDDVDLSKWTLAYTAIEARRIASELHARKPLAMINREIEKHGMSVFPSPFAIA